MKRSVFAAIILFLFGTSAFATIEDYRLAGTIALGDGAFLAIIEMPTGEQHIYHVGDVFESGVVARITDSEASIELPGDEWVLSLAGKASHADTEMPQGPVIASLELNDQHLKSVQALRGTVERDLVSEFSARLALPQGLQVQMVRTAQQEYRSLADALPAIQKALARGEAPHLFFEPGSGLDELYLIARAD